MSKIGKIPVEIKEGVAVVISNGTVDVSGPKGEKLSFVLPNGIEVSQKESSLFVIQKESKEKSFLQTNSKALFGLVRATLANMIEGVSSGFDKKLELSGVGYRAQVSGTDLVLTVGFSHPVTIKAPSGISFNVNESVITITGANKEIVGNTAAIVRAVRPPEPYKGKGISYVGERIRRKAGKAAKAVGTK